MSECKSQIQIVREVLPLLNADSLEIAKVIDWYCVVGKGQYKPGDKCLYIPIDSVLPDALVEVIFKNSKVKPHKNRIKTIKIRGAISQGLVVALDTLGLDPNLKEGTDLTDKLGIKKYEPPESSLPSHMRQGKKVKKYQNSNFKKYTDIQNIKWHPDVFKPEDLVVVTEKIHGTNFRAGWVPYEINCWWKKILKFLRLAPEFEFVYGSHNVQLHEKPYKGFYKENVYAEAVVNYNLEEVIPKGYVVYGEIYGAGVQKGYTYGLKDERKLVLFDAQKDGQYIDYIDFLNLCDASFLPTVPLLYMGPRSEVDIQALYTAPSILSPSQKVMEGVVVKAAKEDTSPCIGRKILKVINPEYLLKDQTDFH